MRTLVVERGQTTIPVTYSLIVAGGVLPVDINRLDWNHWQTSPEVEYAELVSRSTMFPDRPLAIKLHGVLKRSADCLNADIEGKATVDQVWQGMLANRLDVTAEAALLKTFSNWYNGGPKVEWLLADFEPGSIIWVPDCPRDPDKAVKWQNALDRRNDLLTRIFTTPKVRKLIGPEISDVPWDSDGILQCFNWMTNTKFDRHQCALMRWMNMLYMQALKDLLSLAGMYGQSKIIMAFQGRWDARSKDNVWSRPQTKLFAPFQSNLQMYEQGMAHLPAKYIASKSTRWVPTWSGDTGPEELRALLNICTGDTAVLYVERPDLAERLAPTVNQWLSHKEF